MPGLDGLHDLCGNAEDGIDVAVLPVQGWWPYGFSVFGRFYPQAGRYEPSTEPRPDRVLRSLLGRRFLRLS